MAQAVTIREARYSELLEIANVLGAAFYDDNLFGEIIHPHRTIYPQDMSLYWLRRLRVAFWDWRYRFIVAITRDINGKQVIAGIAQWTRRGDEAKKMDLWTIDPRRALAPVSSSLMTIHTWLWPNRAADPVQEDIIERAYPFFNSVWSDARADSWYLEFLAVRPDMQGRKVGYKLVHWGLDVAQSEGVVASVVSALGKNGFYEKCGFDEQYGSAMAGEGNPLKGVEGGDMFWRWPKTES